MRLRNWGLALGADMSLESTANKHAAMGAVRRNVRRVARTLFLIMDRLPRFAAPANAQRRMIPREPAGLTLRVENGHEYTTSATATNMGALPTENGAAPFLRETGLRANGAEQGAASFTPTTSSLTKNTPTCDTLSTTAKRSACRAIARLILSVGRHIGAIARNELAANRLRQEVFDFQAVAL